MASEYLSKSCSYQIMYHLHFKLCMHIHLTRIHHLCSLITSNRLDDAELALRDMDKTKKGTLSKQQMYSLMQQNIKMTGELTKIKKVVIG